MLMPAGMERIVIERFSFIYVALLGKAEQGRLGEWSGFLRFGLF